MSYSGISPKNPSDYRGQKNGVVPAVTRDRRPTGADFRQPETGSNYPITCIWQISKNPTDGVEGELWMLSKIVANVATWIQVNAGGGSGFINSLTGDDGAVVVADGGGNIDLFGKAVANVGAPLYTNGTVGSFLMDLELQITKTLGSAPANMNDAGVSSFNSGQFVVDSNGFTSLVGGTNLPAIQLLSTESGSNIPPTAGGIVNITAETVANGAHTKPLYIDDAVNTVNIELQVGKSITGVPGDKNDAGIVSFDDTAFSVNSDGYVTLIGGPGPALDSFQVQSTGGTGVNPVVSSAAGLMTVSGASVAAHSTPIETISRSANAYNIEVQISDVSAAADTTKNGFSHFDSAAFTIDADGFVGLVGGGTAMVSFGPNSGTDPVIPTGAGKTDIVGSGSTTTVGSLNTLTVQLTGLTNHSVLVGAGTTTITKVGPTATVGQILQSAGAAADPAFSTATYPLTTTANQLLYSSATNTVSGLANGADTTVLTLVAGIPSWVAPTVGVVTSITGGPGITITGTAAVPIVNSVIYTDQTATTLVVDSGTFATEAGAYVLPAAPVIGELVEIVCITTGIIVTANTGQAIQIGADVTSTAGTATNSSKGDSLWLRYRATDAIWYSLSTTGVWTLA